MKKKIETVQNLSNNKYLKNLLFYIYTLLTPIILFLLLILNHRYGKYCGDDCNVKSLTFYYIVQTLCPLLVITNIIWFNFRKKYILNEASFFLMNILNVCFAIYVFLLNVSGWSFILIMVPAIITLPIQFIVWFDIVFKNIFQIKNKKLTKFLAVCCGLIACFFFGLFFV